MKKAFKAYKNLDFLKSREARTIRILAEYLEPEKRFIDHHILHTVVFFGSSRIHPKSSEHKEYEHYYWSTEEMSYQLALYAKELEKNDHGFTICSGGGPGIMEAANRGASRAGAESIGLNISLPHEQHANKYVTDELNFEFHYFFMRKLWFLYHAKAIVFFPGGFGTLDELFETLTLIQTRKLEKTRLPILLFDPTFWNELIDFDRLVQMKLIAPQDIELFHLFSTVEEGVEYLKPKLKNSILNFHLE